VPTDEEIQRHIQEEARDATRNEGGGPRIDREANERKPETGRSVGE